MIYAKDSTHKYFKRVWNHGVFYIQRSLEIEVVMKLLRYLQANVSNITKIWVTKKIYTKFEACGYGINEDMIC